MQEMEENKNKTKKKTLSGQFCARLAQRKPHYLDLDLRPVRKLIIYNHAANIMEPFFK